MLGFEARVHLRLENGQPIMAQMHKSALDRLALHRGQPVSVRLDQLQMFAGEAGSRTAA